MHSSSQLPGGPLFRGSRLRLARNAHGDTLLVPLNQPGEVGKEWILVNDALTDASGVLLACLRQEEMCER